MAGGGGDSIGSYSPLTGFVFIFNLIVGAGALTIPRAFAQVGVLYATIALSVLALTSYATATFMLEAIAGVNALEKYKRELGGAEEGNGGSAAAKATREDAGEQLHGTPEFVPLMVPGQSDDRLEKNLDNEQRIRSLDVEFEFDLSQKMELAQMAHTLFSHNGIIAFYTCVVVYLYGDLAIYAVAVPKSLREIVCPRPNTTVDVWQCTDTVTSSELYRFFVVLFGAVLLPFTLGHVQKTRLLQLTTTLIRHASFGLMIVLAIVGIARGEGRSVQEVLDYERPANIPTFFGVCIYSFMCHHSIPGFVAPITNKAQVGKVIAGSYMAVLSVYLVLCYSATFRFNPDEIDDVYTLNFQSYPVRFFAYFLSLFPVCTLSANFPLICITLRENLRTLARSIKSDAHEQIVAQEEEPTSAVRAFIMNNLFALVTIMPPLVVAFFTEDVSMLVGFTGAYAGVGIQWIVPAFLVFSLRRQLEAHRIRVAGKRAVNPFGSPFAHTAWLYFILAFSLGAFVVITIAHGVE